MSYLVGRFSRDGYYDNTLFGAGIVENISKQHLVDAQSDEDYQVINLATLEYYEPKKNEWLKVQRF